MGENKDSYGNEYRTVLKRSEYDGLIICKLKKTPTPIDFAPDTAVDDDVDPTPQTSTTTAKLPHECWTECFDKFYINKNDDWKKIGNILRDFCCGAHAVLNASAPAGIDIVPPTPPATPIEQSVPKKRKSYNNTKGGSTKKAAKKSKVVPATGGEEEAAAEATSEVREIEIFFKKIWKEILIVVFFFSKIQ